jgi:hypothetical protein
VAQAQVQGQEQQQQNTTANPPAPTTVTIQQSVGAGGANMPADVLQVQNRLVALGYLSTANFQAEQANPANATAIADTAMRETIVAISRYFQAAFGRPGLLLEPNQASSAFLNRDLAQPVGTTTITGNVGRGAANAASDVRLIQQRLRAIGFLTEANLTAEAVAETATGVIADANLAQTITAINNFNTQVVGISLYIIRPNSRELTMLNNPPAMRAGTVTITNTVGTAQQNNPADVRAVQTRLVALGFLTADQQTAEAPATDAAARVADAAITQTIAAINQFQRAMGLTANGQVVPGSDTHRQLMNPALHERSSMTLTARVGDGPDNQPGDVRLIQDRLQSIGLLSASDYMAERVDTTQTNPINSTAFPQTMAAMTVFLTTVVSTDQTYIDPGSRALRLLNDPTYGTMSNFNTEANNAQAGIAIAADNAEINRIVNAIFGVEAGNRTGEIGAELANGAGTPASFGQGQLIGATALSTLRAGTARDMRQHYGLTDAALTEMNDRATNTRDTYNAILDGMPAAGMTTAALTAAISTYTTANGQTFVTQTGLGFDDISRMHHNANLIRRIRAVPAPTGNRDARRRESTRQVGILMNNESFSNSMTVLGMDRTSVEHYFNRRDHHNEMRQAFITKAILSHPEGQRVRNALTDNRGPAIGRALVRENHATASRTLRGQNARTIAAGTAILHNSGSIPRSNGQPDIATMMANDYVANHFLPRYDGAH